jgi:hypothetical protein
MVRYDGEIDEVATFSGATISMITNSSPIAFFIKRDIFDRGTVASHSTLPF